MIASWYGKAIINAFGGESEGESTSIDFLTNEIRVSLCTSSYTPDLDTHEFFSDVTNEVTGGNYAATPLVNKSLTYDSATNKAIFDADNITWANSTITARHAVIYKWTGSAATSPLLGYVNFEQDYSSSSGNFTITWDSGGIFTATVV